MTKIVVLFALIAFLLCGCRSQSRATATILVETDRTELTQATITDEIRAIRDIAPAFVSADWSYDVQHISGTGKILVSVTTPDPEISISQCNQIIQRYVRTAKSPVTRRVLEDAAVLKERKR